MGKVRISVFWGAEGMVESLKRGTTITGFYYADQIRRFRGAIKKKGNDKLQAGVLFHQDNVPVYKPAISTVAVQEM